MKVLLAMHNIIDPGGIVNHVYQLQLGLKDIGHEVVCAVFTNGNDNMVKTELVLDQKKLPKDVTVGYKSSTATAVSFIKEFDYVIWEVPIPTKAKQHKGNILWPELYDHGVPQVAIIHDDHITDRTPWIHHIMDKFLALIAVQTCGHYSCSTLAIPSGIIVNPFDLTERAGTAYSDRVQAIIGACVWKPKKHMQDLISAIPHMDSDIDKIIGGGGIEQCYMSSKTKCKEQYKIAGIPIWDNALANGMDYRGFIQNEERIALYNKVKVVVDPSYISNWKVKGRSLTRVFIEGAICGAVPVAREEFVDPKFFQAGINYIPMPLNAPPEEVANVLNAAVHMAESEYSEIAEANVQATKQFCRKAVAQKYIDMLDPDLRGALCTSGTTSRDVISRSSIALKSFFGIKVVGRLSRWI